MIEFGNIIYYIDINALDAALVPTGVKPTDTITLLEQKDTFDASGVVFQTEIVETTSLRGKEIDTTKYEVIRMMLEVLISYDTEIDTTLGTERALSNLPLSVNLAFNTLYELKILKEKN